MNTKYFLLLLLGIVGHFSIAQETTLGKVVDNLGVVNGRAGIAWSSKGAYREGQIGNLKNARNYVDPVRINQEEYEKALEESPNIKRDIAAGVFQNKADLVVKSDPLKEAVFSKTSR